MASFYLRWSVENVVLQKSTATQVRLPIFYYFFNDAYVDGFVWDLTFAKRLLNHFMRNQFQVVSTYHKHT